MLLSFYLKFDIIELSWCKFFSSASAVDVDYRSNYECLADLSEWSRTSPPCEHAIAAHQSDWHFHTTTAGIVLLVTYGYFLQ